MVKSMFNNYSAVSIGYLERMCSGILLLLFYDKLNALGKNMTLFYNLFFCMLFCRLFLAEFDTLPVRFSYLFMSSYCILYPTNLQRTEYEVEDSFSGCCVSVCCYQSVPIGTR